MTADPGGEFEAEGVLNPASGRGPDGRLWLLPRLVAAGNVSRVGLAEMLVRDGRPVGVRRDGVVLAPDAGWERSHDHAGVEDPRMTWIAEPRRARDDLRRLRAARPETGARRVGRSARLAAARSGALRLRAGPGYRSEPVPEQGRRVLSRAGPGPGRPARVRHAASPDVGPRLDPRRQRRLPAGRARRSPPRHLDLLRPGRRGSSRRRALTHVRLAPTGGAARVRLRGAQDRRRAAAAARRGGLAAASITVSRGH